ncbi:MAG: tRNA (adenosine(37)-N6)-threonylcarbamoyltransferase complex ATPase subunit type 1 TsaE [Desulfatiglandaceae bacterium]
MGYCRLEILSRSDDDTVLFGKRLGSLLIAGDVVALAGEPGSGKTWLTKGIASGLGVGPGIIVTSPSFSLINEYEGRCLLYHMDVYRLGTLDEFLDSGLEEYFYRDAVVVLEWANRWPELLSRDSLIVEILILAECSRRIVLSGHGERPRKLVEMLKQKPDKELEWR